MARRSSAQDYAVIGLGRFGSSLALKLVELGHSVLAIDRDRELVQQLSDDITQTVALDATDEGALRAIGIEEFDTAIVAIGNDFESNLLITVLLKEIGLPTVICKALNERQKSILLRVGANQVVLPEHEAGIRLARQLSMPLVAGRFELEPGISISEVRCPEPLVGHSLGELDLPGQFGISVLVIKGARLRSAPADDEVLNAGDILVVMGPDAGIAKLHAWSP